MLRLHRRPSRPEPAPPSDSSSRTRQGPGHRRCLGSGASSLAVEARAAPPRSRLSPRCGAEQIRAGKDRPRHPGQSMRRRQAPRAANSRRAGETEPGAPLGGSTRHQPKPPDRQFHPFRAGTWAVTKDQRSSALRGTPSAAFSPTECQMSGLNTLSHSGVPTSLKKIARATALLQTNYVEMPAI